MKATRNNTSNALPLTDDDVYKWSSMRVINSPFRQWKRHYSAEFLREIGVIRILTNDEWKQL